MGEVVEGKPVEGDEASQGTIEKQPEVISMDIKDDIKEGQKEAQNEASLEEKKSEKAETILSSPLKLSPSKQQGSQSLYDTPLKAFIKPKISRLEELTFSQVEDESAFRYETFETLIFDGLTIIELDPLDKAFLEKFSECRQLSFNDCGLRSLANFPSMSKVTRLELANNRLFSRKDPLGQLPIQFKQLQHLILANNFLDFDSVKPLAKLGDTLTKLDLSANQLAEAAAYPKNLFDLVTSLKSVDGRDIDGKDCYDDIVDDFEDLDENERIPLYLVKKELAAAEGKRKQQSDSKTKHKEVVPDDEDEEEDDEMMGDKKQEEDIDEDEDEDDDIVEEEDDPQEDEEYYVEEDEVAKEDNQEGRAGDDDDEDESEDEDASVGSNLGKRRTAPENPIVQKNFQSPNIRVNSGNGSLANSERKAVVKFSSAAIDEESDESD
ncbi:hypothetical protein FGO68_gene15686 [Halteria grandinella]|uniref:Uncharacterized protein n=1 Tax=Halteria grandinella TaxID=5974 RepID=A0A8J8P6Q6_HALGN|nr:hypothetical protein FGO68_gene15686 [Halteria grandinella]